VSGRDGNAGDARSEGTLERNPELERAAEEAAEAVAGDAVRADIRELESELEETRDRLLRLQADFDNFRKRVLKEREEAHRFGHQNLVKDLLPTVDNLERALEHARTSRGADLEGFLQGVELVLREVLGVLEQYGVTEVEAEDRAFDPNVHEAVGQKEAPGRPPGTVVQVVQKGYQLRDRLLRPARVLVATPGEAGESSGAGSGESGDSSG